MRTIVLLLAIAPFACSAAMVFYLANLRERRHGEDRRAAERPTPSRRRSDISQ